MGLKSLSAPGAQTKPLMLIIRTNINKAIHRHVNSLQMAVLGLSMSQYDTILCGLCILFLVANLSRLLALVAFVMERQAIMGQVIQWLLCHGIKSALIYSTYLHIHSPFPLCTTQCLIAHHYQLIVVGVGRCTRAPPAWG